MMIWQRHHKERFFQSFTFFFVSLTPSYTIYYSSQSLCITNGLRIRTNQGSPNYQEGNGFPNNACQRRNWQRSEGGPGRRDQTATVCRRRKSHCSTWDKHNFILMNNWESLELGWDKCARAACVSVSWQHLDCFQLRIRAEPRLLPGSNSTLIIWGHNKTQFWGASFPQDAAHFPFQLYVWGAFAGTLNSLCSAHWKGEILKIIIVLLFFVLDEFRY